MFTITLSDKDRNAVYHLLARQAIRAIDNEEWGRLADLFEKPDRVEVRYDYDINGYTAQLLNDSGGVEDHITVEIQIPLSIETIRSCAIEAAIDFMESYDVDGDPVRDPTIRGGQNAATLD